MTIVRDWDSSLHDVLQALTTGVSLCPHSVIIIQIRWNHKSLQLLSSDELDFIIASVCTGQA